MNALPRRIPPRETKTRTRSLLRSRPAAAVGAVAVSAGLVAGGVSAFAFADPAAPAEPSTPPAQAVGTVFANRPAPDAAQIPGASDAQQFSYWTKGADGQTHLSTALLVEPTGPTPAEGRKVVVYAHDPDGLVTECGPTASRGARDVDVVSGLLRSSYAVLIPDYAVVGTAGSPQYVDFAATAAEVGDAVRAAGVIGEDLGSEWAVFGDGLGAGVAVRSAQSSAKAGAGDFRGAVATALPVDYAATVADLSPNSPKADAATVVDVVYALASLDPEKVEPILTERGTELVSAAANMCSAELTRKVGGTGLGDLVKRPLASIDTLAADLRSALTLPTSGFDRPLMLSQKLTAADLTTNAQYVAQAQLSSNKVSVRTYFTGDPRDADRQERAAVRSYLDHLFK